MRGPAIVDLDDRLNMLAQLYQFRDPNLLVYGGLTVSQSYCLRILYRQGPHAMGSLAEQLAVTLSTVTGVVDQLERRGLVVRKHDTQDRRRFQVDLTPEGRRKYRRAHEAFLSHLEPVFTSRTAAQRRQIVTFLDDVMRMIDGWRAHPRRVSRAAPHSAR